MSLIRTLAKRCIWKTGGYTLVAATRPWRGVAVLTYHGVRDATATALGTSEELHVRQQELERHLRALRALATPISLDQWRQARRGGRPLPDRSVLVTFDDGYRSVWQFALPLLERYDVPAVAFVCTGPAQTGQLLWYDALELRGRAGEVESAKQLTYDAWKRLADEVRTLADANHARAVMTPEEIATLSQHPLIEIGAHTVDHPVLARASVAVQRQQIADSIETLQRWTRRPVRAFAYPNGRRCDFTAETVAMLDDVGVDCAFSTEPRIAACDDSWKACPRFTMLDSISDAHLAQYLSVSWPRAIS